MHLETSEPSQFDDFACSLNRDDIIDWLRCGLIGEGTMVPGPHGPNPLIYADYVASGRALRQIEEFVTDRILPFYANSHTEASYCGQMMTRLRKAPLDPREVATQAHAQRLRQMVLRCAACPDQAGCAAMQAMSLTCNAPPDCCPNREAFQRLPERA